MYLNISKQKAFQSRTLFLKGCPDPDPEQKAELFVAHSGEANLSHPLPSVMVASSSSYLHCAAGVLTK